jgi:hypothetical protein
MDVADGAEGEFTRFGLVNDIDTSSFNVGDILYLDDNRVDGGITNVRPMFPGKAIVVGYCLKVGVSDGKILVVIEPDNYQHQFDGTAVQQQDITIVESGGTVYADVKLNGGGNLPVQINGTLYQLNCTTGSGVGGAARVALTAGTDTAPQLNFIYVDLVGSTPTLQSSTARPTGVFAYIGYASIWSAAKTATDGPARFQRTTDAIYHNGRGRIAHIDESIRRLGATWDEGVDPSVVITPSGVAPDAVVFSNLAGKVYQLHVQDFPALSIDTDGIYVANASGAGVLTKYQKITDLNQCLEDTAGNAFSNNDRFNLVVWGAVNKTTGDCKLFVNLPSATYASDDPAYYDFNATAITSVEKEFVGVAFLIARIPLRYTTSSSGTWAFINPVGESEIIPLLGVPVSSSGAGSSGAGGATTINQLADANYSGPVLGHGLYYDGVDTFRGGAKVIGNITTVNAATYTLLEGDEVLDVQYAGPVEITAPDTEKAKVGRAFVVSDAWRKSALVNNITVKDGSGNLILTINGNGDEAGIRSNGTDWS